MSTYDIAAGITQAGLNTLVSKLYNLPAVRTSFFSGSVTKSIGSIGSVTVGYDVKVAPTFVLSPPTQAQWTAAQKQNPSAPLPTTNAFQLVLSDLLASAQLSTPPPLSAEGPVTVIGVVNVTNGIATLTAVAVLIDESSFSAWDQLIVNDILLPALFQLADSLLANLPLPQIPTFEGLEFQPLALGIESSGIVIGSTLNNGGTTNLAGFTWPPSQSLFVVSQMTPINKFFALNVNGTHTEQDQTGPSAWTASGQVTATNLLIVGSISGGVFDLDISGSFSATGELSGAAVGVVKTVMCPIATAADAIANPSGWDKVTSTFDLKYNPNPMPVPITATAAAPAGSPLTQAITLSIPSDKLPSSIQLVVAPTWSGSVTGSALAAAASAFVDLISVLFGKIIINDLVNKYGSKTFSLPSSEMTKKLTLPGNATVTIAVAAPVGPALGTFGNQLLQPLQITLS